MIVNRLRQNNKLNDKMVVVWLGEDDIVTNFLDMALSILRTLARVENFSLDVLENAKGKNPDEASSMILDSITEQLGDRTILLIKENMSDIFHGLKEYGQKQLRAYLQDKKNMLMLTTSQQLFEGVSSRDAVFFGFFDIHHLSPLTVDDAMELISKVAKLKGDNELAEFVHTPQGRYRVRALHHLAGGNHRLYMNLMEFLTVESLDNLVSALVKLADELTPYFQERIKSLPPQQGMIAQKLCDIEGAISVKDLAQELFIGERSVSKQLGDLLKKGYVLAHKRGKLTYYEIAEPLMRLSLQVKHTKGEPLKILVLLLRAWFSDDELSSNISQNKLYLSYIKQALSTDEEIKTRIADTITNAMHTENNEEKLLQLYHDLDAIPMDNIPKILEKLKLVNNMLENLLNTNDLRENNINQASYILTDVKIEITSINNTADHPFPLDNLHALLHNMHSTLGSIYSYRNLHDDAIIHYTIALESEYTSIDKIEILKSRALSFQSIEQWENAILDHSNIINHNKSIKEDIIDSLCACGICYIQISKTEQAINNYLEILDISNNLNITIRSYLSLSYLYMMQDKIDKAMKYIKKVLKYAETYPDEQAFALEVYSDILRRKGKYKKAISCLEDLILQYSNINNRVTENAYVRLSGLYYITNDIIKFKKIILSLMKFRKAIKSTNTLKLKELLLALAISPTDKWKNNIEYILDIFDQYESIEYLGTSLIHNIEYYLNEETYILLKTWQKTWQKAAAKYELMQPSLKALEAVQLSIEQKSDKPMFALSKEIRDLILPKIKDMIN